MLFHTMLARKLGLVPDIDDEVTEPDIVPVMISLNAFAGNELENEVARLRDEDEVTGRWFRDGDRISRLSDPGVARLNRLLAEFTDMDQ
ncbi:hypothetical protein HYT45_02920 [Candidatus Uhrbacteria bacterium]|nr:hypothetical protein [Candidatus Uhrbacteria bacterium]